VLELVLVMEQGLGLVPERVLVLELHRQIIHPSVPPKLTEIVFVFYSFYSSS